MRAGEIDTLAEATHEFAARIQRAKSELDNQFKPLSEMEQESWRMFRMVARGLRDDLRSLLLASHLD